MPEVRRPRKPSPAATIRHEDNDIPMALDPAPNHISYHTLKVTLNGTGFAADYTARTYGLIPHRNGVAIELAGVTSGTPENARRFAATHGVKATFTSHEEMVRTLRPDIDNIACANYAHGAYTIEAARAGVKVIVLEKPPVIWPGYAQGRAADPTTMKRESMAYLGEVLDAVRHAG